MGKGGGVVLNQWRCPQCLMTLTIDQKEERSWTLMEVGTRLREKLLKNKKVEEPREESRLTFLTRELHSLTVDH